MATLDAPYVLESLMDHTGPSREDFEAAREGDSNAMFNLGLGFARIGQIDDAVHWYTRAAEHGDNDAVANLGLLLRDQERYDEAEKWLRHGAEAGHAMSANNLGNLLLGWLRFDEALLWAERAVELGSTAAAGNLERVRLLARYHVPDTDPNREFARGMELVEKADVDAALPHLGAAAAQAHPDAAFELASLLAARGELDDAAGWYRIAAKLGNPRAMARLREVLDEG